MAKVLVALSILWPMLLASGWWSRTHDGPPWLTATVYFSAGRVCHQRPERSFRTSGAPWPVCGRCSGLYLSAPIGAIAAVWPRRRARVPSTGWLVAAALPTALTMAMEVMGAAPMTSLARCLAAVPLGAAVAFLVVSLAGPRHAIG